MTRPLKSHSLGNLAQPKLYTYSDPVEPWLSNQFTSNGNIYHQVASDAIDNEPIYHSPKVMNSRDIYANDRVVVTSPEVSRSNRKQYGMILTAADAHNTSGYQNIRPSIAGVISFVIFIHFCIFRLRSGMCKHTYTYSICMHLELYWWWCVVGSQSVHSNQAPPWLTLHIHADLGEPLGLYIRGGKDHGLAIYVSEVEHYSAAGIRYILWSS